MSNFVIYNPDKVDALKQKVQNKVLDYRRRADGDDSSICSDEYNYFFGDLDRIDESEGINTEATENNNIASELKVINDYCNVQPVVDQQYFEDFLKYFDTDQRKAYLSSYDKWLSTKDVNFSVDTAVDFLLFCLDFFNISYEQFVELHGKMTYFDDDSFTPVFLGHEGLDEYWYAFTLAGKERTQ